MGTTLTMRSLSRFGVLALSTFVTAISSKTSIAELDADVDAWTRTRALVTGQQFKQSLRRFDTAEEERRVVDMVDDVINKVGDKLAIVVHRPFTLPIGLNGATLEQADEVVAKIKAAMAEYPERLSGSAKEQLLKIEQQRILDQAVLAKMTKKTEDGMRRDMEPFPGMKTSPILKSHGGRGKQRYAEDDSRLMTCTVVSRPAKGSGREVLLISSSDPKKREWLLPKGGWDEGESVHKATWREVMEEGGVSAVFRKALGTLKFQKTEVNKKTKETKVKKYVYHAYEMDGVTTYDQWAESMRYRIWVRNQIASNCKNEELCGANVTMCLVN
ncbi:unnamed protein product [Phytophthora fragariaefolia]|uniref:Unnamed protein product n=1 Tax=Phytophthora fragariaefolia TaxID=1490495 RepID=A0A9W7CTS9_9STRA|nr:unnamed protein product [Phytophthora fragariaefolia]